MQRIISPIDDPDRKWNFINLSRLSVVIRGREQVLRTTKVKDKFWVGDIEFYHLDAPPEVLLGPNLVVCWVFKAFGQEAGIQNWGFNDEMENGGGRQAVCFDGKWFLMEKGEILEIIPKEQASPFTAVRLTLYSDYGIMVQEYKRPPI